MGLHTFHIPVLGISYSIDTPVKVAKYGIASVMSIIDDELIEKMRAYYCAQYAEEYIPISTREEDYRARRITAYLNLVNKIVSQQVATLKGLPFEANNELAKYFEVLPTHSAVRKLYYDMCALPEGREKIRLQEELRNAIEPGAIDVNIMAKVDNVNHSPDGTLLPPEYSDALAAFRGYANSTLSSSVILSAGYNPRLYGYIENFGDFFPDAEGKLKKKIVLKVSDYRSALIQGRIMAKKGIWISEYRIESGLNCGGHAFATDGLLLGPILDEFKEKKAELMNELCELCNESNAAKNRYIFSEMPKLKITVQGGIGTSKEDRFLIENYAVDGTGWGSPFLLVPEATNVEDGTLKMLSTAKKEDYYVSNASPLGVPFNNIRNSTAELQRTQRIEKNRPGSPCYKKYLVSNTEFTEEPICTASRKYQKLKIDQLNAKGISGEQYKRELNDITAKDCLCEGLETSVLLKNGMPLSHKLNAVTICPGPNLAYFSGVFSLREMADHIYGRLNILNSLTRQNMFINELNLYIDYLKKMIDKNVEEVNAKQHKYLNTFKTNLTKGIEYYKSMIPKFKQETQEYLNKMLEDLLQQEKELIAIQIP